MGLEGVKQQVEDLQGQEGGDLCMEVYHKPCSGRSS
jgi:hypothetical protein